MPVQVSYPGVYIQEVPSGVRTITGVSTSVALFIGMNQRGPFEQAVSLTSFADYERAFGTDRTVSETTDQVNQFFLNGGKRAFVIRTAQGALPASVVLRNEAGTDVLTITAAENGEIGDSIRLEINYDTARPESTFTIVASREVSNATGQPEQVEVETLSDLTMDSTGARFVQTTVEQESHLIRAAVHGSAPAPIQGYSMSGNAVADILAELNTQLTNLGNTGGFQISVDGGPLAPVTLTKANNAATLSLTDVQDALDAALESSGGGVAVETASFGGLEALRIRSTANGGSVQVLSGASNDLAGPLHLGISNDGLEVGGHAPRRPAPTGFFASLGDLDSTAGAAWLDDLAALATTAPNDPLDIEITTTQGGLNVQETASVAGLTAASLWESTPPAGTSLRNLRGALNAIAQQLAAATNFRWTPSVNGFRLILNPTFASRAEQASATATVDGNNLGYLGEAANIRRAPLGNTNVLSNYVNAGQPGDDGLVPQLLDYQRAFGIADRQIDLFNLMILPRVLADRNDDGQSDTDRLALWGPASAFCREQRAFLLMDAPTAWGTAQTAETGVPATRIGVVGDHAMQTWPRLRVTDPTTGLLRTIDPSGSVAGIAARIDGSRGVWKAPAGLEASVVGARGVEHRVSDAENGILNPQAINVVRQFPNGIVVWGSRTVAGFDNSGENDYKYVPVRRTALFIEESLYRGLQWAVFEPNDEPLWAELRLAAGAFMNNLFRRGAFQGSTAREAYFVKCDAETTTQNDINLGIVNVVIGFAPLKPAEFVVITLRQLAGQVQT